MDTLISKLAALEIRARELEAASAERENELATAREELDARARLIVEKATKIQQQSECITQLESERTTLDSRLSTLSVERDELIRSTSEQKQQADYYLKERDSNYKAFVEKNAEYDKIKKVAHDRLTRISELEDQIAEQAKRQQTFDEELAKTEAQLDMLKDLLRPESV